MSRPVALILLVDGSKDCRDIFRAALAHIGYEPVEAETGEEGLCLARELKPDLVVTEFPIPVAGYPSLTEAVRADRSLTDVRILSVTAHALPGVEERARRAGVDGFLTKPIKLSVLIAEVQRYVSPPGAAL